MRMATRDDNPLVNLHTAKATPATLFSTSRHLAEHPGETDYVCAAQGCGKRFSTTGNLARHRRRHGFIPPLCCPADRCKYSTNAAHKLARHMRVHRESSLRVCAFSGCGKTFATTGNLNRHIRTQHIRPRGARPGRPRGSSVGRDPVVERGLVEGEVAVEALSGSDELLATLSLFLDDADSPRPDGEATRDSESSHEALECSDILDELAKFHAAHSPV